MPSLERLSSISTRIGPERTLATFEQRGSAACGVKLCITAHAFSKQGDPFEIFNSFFGGADPFGGGGKGDGRRQKQRGAGGGGFGGAGFPGGGAFGGGGFPGAGGGFGAAGGGGGGGGRAGRGGGGGQPGDGLYAGAKDVVEITSGSFPATAGSAGFVYLVEFYAPVRDIALFVLGLFLPRGIMTKALAFFAGPATRSRALDPEHGHHAKVLSFAGIHLNP
jgi:hypothetical protein